MSDVESIRYDAQMEPTRVREERERVERQKADLDEFAGVIEQWARRFERNGMLEPYSLLGFRPDEARMILWRQHVEAAALDGFDAATRRGLTEL